METTPVLIVGAGYGGLSTAAFLGRHGVPSLVVERHPGLSTQPKARGQAPATMEALATLEVAGRFLAANPPGRPEMKIVIAESMTGMVLHSFAEAMPDLSAYSPAPAGLVSQERAERILADRAIELGARILFGTELETFAQDGERVTAQLRDVATGRPTTVTARYLVAADGHKGGIRDALGIGVHGRTAESMPPTLFAQFEADLLATLDGAAFGLWHLRGPGLPHGGATVVTTDQPGRFVIGGAFSPDPDQLVAGIRTAAGVPDLDVTILETAWTSSGDHITRVADRFGAGRAFLVGDAAHLMPPTGGQGGNAAVMDGYHLAWKLAAVLDGRARESLLDSHDAERRPYADLLAEQQYANLVQRGAPELRDETVAEIMDPVTGLFGYVCPAGAFVPEPGDVGLFEDPAKPSGRPGARAPHVALEDGSSTRDLFGREFVLLTSDPNRWLAAAADLDVAVRPMIDNDRFREAYGLGPEGAVLVRPDGIIGWRSSDPAGLGAALASIL